ncbi:MAG: sugar kinase [Ruminococcus sp.]|nr:sugar kinase [Ruminococcus sp.]
MKRATENKVVLVTQKTRLENLIHRYNTLGQAKFYIEHHGGDFNDYVVEHETYKKSVEKAVAFLESYGRLQLLDRDYVPSFIFGKNDTVVAVGRDGLVANTLKYLDSQKLIGVNPDPRRWDGVLLPFSADDLNRIVPETVGNVRKVKNITLAQAQLNDGQVLCGVNDLFIGQKTHVSARYEITSSGKSEFQSSSGIIVSTGLGATGWLKSIIAGASGIDRYCGVSDTLSIDSDFSWDSRYLYFTVREPYPSTSTGASIVFGKIKENEPVRIVSQMPENGVIFSDGVEQDYLEFNSGAIATIGLADKSGNLVV